MRDSLKIHGRYELFLPNGRVLRGRNLVPAAGLAQFAELALTAAEAEVISHAALGNGADAPDATDTALVSEQAGSRKAHTSANRTSNSINYTFSGWGPVGTDWVDVVEFGLFTDATAGILMARFTTPVFTIGDGLTILLNWSITFGA